MNKKTLFSWSFRINDTENTFYIESFNQLQAYKEVLYFAIHSDITLYKIELVKRDIV